MKIIKYFTFASFALGLLVISTYSQTSRLIGDWDVIDNGIKIGSITFRRQNNRETGKFTSITSGKRHNVTAIRFVSDKFRFNVNGEGLSFRDLSLNSNELSGEMTRTYVHDKPNRTVFITLRKPSQ